MQNTDYTFIDNETSLNQFSASLLNNPDIDWIAIDTEFVRKDTYFPELSLVQIQDNQGLATLIDPLAIQQNGSLSGLVDILVDPTLLKVFHAARQDVEVLYQLAQQMPVSIFDTQLAAIFFGHGDIAGFARVVENELGHRLPKSQTRTNWHARPLSAEQIEYALDDVRYLAPLYEKFRSHLSSEQLKALQADFEALLDESLYQPNPAKAGEKVKGTRSLRPKSLAIVNRLAQWREEYAIEQNQPKKWVMSDEVIIGIAKRPPKAVEALYKVPHIKSSSVKAFGSEWITLVDEVFAQTPDCWPAPQPKPSPITGQEEVLVLLSQALCQQVALNYQLNINNLISKAELVTLIRAPQQPVLSGWRDYLIQAPLQHLLQGQMQLHCVDNRLESSPL